MIKEKRFRMAMLRDEEKNLGIGIEEYEPGGPKAIINQIGSIFVKGPVKTKYAMFKKGIAEVVEMAGECDRIIVKSPNRFAVFLADEFEEDYPQIEVRGIVRRRSGDCITLAEDALKRKTTIKEDLR